MRDLLIVSHESLMMGLEKLTVGHGSSYATGSQFHSGEHNEASCTSLYQ